MIFNLILLFQCRNLVHRTEIYPMTFSTFQDTRNCIAARLEMEDENEKLVSEEVV